MRKTSATALASDPFTGEDEMRMLDPGIPRRINPAAVLKLSAPADAAAPVATKRFLSFHYSTEQIRDFLWLMAAIVVIAIIHYYLPNRGAAPHSIVDIVKSTPLFPG